MKITFLGAAKTVTGSCHMVQTESKTFLIDCGMFQGKLTDQMLNYEELPFNVNDIDFVILTHAHIDHAGRIPKLYKQGYTGKVYATTATVDLCRIMLPDSGHIQEKEIEWVNKKRKRAGKAPTEPMYTAQDAIDSLKIFEGVEYNQLVQIDDKVSFKLIDAGHMLGSAIVELDVYENGKNEHIVFTGDLGNVNMPIINDPTYIERADHLIIESTYGNRIHPAIEDQTDEFIDILLTTISRGGNVIIPSFAVGRTQEILYELNKYASMKKIGKEISKIPVYVDSPLAVNATEIFKQNPEYYDEEALKYLLKGKNPLEFENLHFITTAEESKALNEDMVPKVIISASGMCEVGRIKHHLKHNLYRPECTVLFVGFQAEGTLGRKILSGEKLVKIFGEEIAVNAEIRQLEAFSGHADANGLITWIDRIKNKPENIFIVHGEYSGQLAFKDTIENKFGIKCVIPGFEETYEIDGRIDKAEVKYKSTRFDVLELLSFLKQDVDDMTNVVKANIKHNVDESELYDLIEKLNKVKDDLYNIKNMR